MAGKNKKKVSKIKVKKKIWHKIIGPKIFGNKEIGESYLTSADNAINRKLKISLKDLTGNVRDQNAYINLQITKISGSNLNTEVMGYQLTPSYIKRVVRKNTNRLDDYFSVKTKDNREIIVKSLIITLNKTQRSTKTQLRKEFQEMFAEEAKKMTFDDLVANIVNKKIQIASKKKLNKVHPLKEVSIRVIKIKGKRLDTAIVDETLEEPVEETKEELIEEEITKDSDEKSEEVVSEDNEEEKQE